MILPVVLYLSLLQMLRIVFLLLLIVFISFLIFFQPFYLSFILSVYFNLLFCFPLFFILIGGLYFPPILFNLLLLIDFLDVIDLDGTIINSTIETEPEIISHVDGSPSDITSSNSIHFFPQSLLIFLTSLSFCLFDLLLLILKRLNQNAT